MTNKFKYHYNRTWEIVPDLLEQIIEQGKKTNLKDLVGAQKRLIALEQELEAYKAYVRGLKSQTECQHNKHIIVHDHGVSCDWCNGFFRSETKLETTDD